MLLDGSIDKLIEIFEKSPTAFYALDKVWNFIYVNNQMEKIFRKTKQELLGNQYWEVFPKAVNDQIYTELNRALETGLQVSFEDYNAVQDKWYEIIASPSSAGIAVFIHDITIRKHNEYELAKAKYELEDFLENATVGIHLVNSEGRILYANKAELNLLGYTKEEYIGHNIADFHADEKAITEIFKKLSNKEDVYNYEASLRCKDGSLRYVLISSNVYWKDNQFIHTRCFTRDISPRKKMERLLSLLNKASKAMVSSLSINEIIEKLAEALVPEYTDWLSINEIEQDHLVLLKLASENQQMLDWAINYRHKVPVNLERIKPNSMSYVCTTGKSVLVSQITNADLEKISNDHEHLMALYHLQLTSYMMVPLILNGKVTGCINFMSNTPHKQYDEADLKFAQDMASYLALALENARLYENVRKDMVRD